MSRKRKVVVQQEPEQLHPALAELEAKARAAGLKTERRPDTNGGMWLNITFDAGSSAGSTATANTSAALSISTAAASLSARHAETGSAHEAARLLRSVRAPKTDLERDLAISSLVVLLAQSMGLTEAETRRLNELVKMEAVL